MRTAIIHALGYVGAFWAGAAIFMAAGIVAMITAARRGRPLHTLARFFAPFAVMALLYEGWLFGLPAATIAMLVGFALLSMAVLEWRLRFFERHLGTSQEVSARRDNLNGNGHA